MKILHSVASNSHSISFKYPEEKKKPTTNQKTHTTAESCFVYTDFLKYLLPPLHKRQSNQTKKKKNKTTHRKEKLR